MTTNAAPQKLVREPERAVALAAIATARLKHKHVGIRPKKERGSRRRTAGILVPPGSNPGTGLDEALGKAGQTWPDYNSWEVFGANDFGDFSDDSSCDDTLGDGWFDGPEVYGEFATLDDEPGWLGGYPA